MSLKSQKNKGFTLQLRISTPDRGPSEKIGRVLNYIVESNKQLSTHSISLDDFYIPEWYKLSNKLPAGGLDMELNCVHSIHLISSNYMETGIIDTVLWDQVYLTQKRTWPIPLAFGVTIGTVFFFILFAIKSYTWKRAIQNNILNQYQARDSKADSEWDFIRNYFSKNYANSDFQITQAAKEIGISQKKLSSTIKDQLQITTNTYLNELRLKEGARLLVDTNMPINQIAFEVGYNSVEHFNRQFKTKFECTPKQYRSDPQT